MESHIFFSVFSTLNPLLHKADTKLTLMLPICHQKWPVALTTNSFSLPSHIGVEHVSQKNSMRLQSLGYCPHSLLLSNNPGMKCSSVRKQKELQRKCPSLSEWLEYLERFKAGDLGVPKSTPQIPICKVLDLSIGQGLSS